MYKTIVVGTDGSESAREAVDRAMTIAERFDATLHAITVVNTRRYGEPAFSSTELVLNELETRGNEQLREIKEQCTESGIACETQCFHGEPSAEIIQYAHAHDADMIVLGYQGRTHSGERMGSTASRVVNGTDRPVLLV